MANEKQCVVNEFLVAEQETLFKYSQDIANCCPGSPCISLVQLKMH